MYVCLVYSSLLKIQCIETGYFLLVVDDSSFTITQPAINQLFHVAGTAHNLLNLSLDVYGSYMITCLKFR